MFQVHLSEALAVFTIISGAVGWYATVRLQRGASRAQHTFEALMATNFDPLYQQHLRNVRPYIYPEGGFGPAAPGPPAAVKESTDFLLNYYEFLAGALLQGVLAETLLRDDQANIVRRLFLYSRDQIHALREELGRPQVWRSFEWLFYRWNGGGIPVWDRVVEWVLTRPVYRAYAATVAPPP